MTDSNTTHAPVTVERLRELQAKYRGGVERIDPIGARVVQWTELIVILDELLASRETIAKLESSLAFAATDLMHMKREKIAAQTERDVARELARNSRSPAVDTYQHKLHCNAGGRTPLGGDMCICLIPEAPAVKQATACGDTEGLVEQLRELANDFSLSLRGKHAKALEQAIAALTPLTTPQGKDAWLYDGYAVFEALTTVQRRFVSAEAVSAVLDAIARIQRAAPSSCTGEGKT